MNIIEQKEKELKELKGNIDFNSDKFNSQFLKIQELSKEIEVLKVNKLKGVSA